MQIISVNSGNIDTEHICCALGGDAQNRERTLTKKSWMKKRFEDGLVFRRLDERGKVFIEYMPIEASWKPVEGRNLMVIHCLWVSGQFKGKGLSSRLLDECRKDAVSKGMDGIAVVTSTAVKPFLTDKKFYLNHGFEPVDTALPYFELLALRLNRNMTPPRFSEHAKLGTSSTREGFSFIYTNQCPFMEEYVGILSGIVKARNIPFTVTRLEDREQILAQGSPFGTLGMYYNGKFVTHELMSEKKFNVLLDSML